MKKCERCNGCGMLQSWYGEDCSDCGGTGEVDDLASLNEGVGGMSEELISREEAVAALDVNLADCRDCQLGVEYCPVCDGIRVAKEVLKSLSTRLPPESE
jgi:RecJ-like exonuclease